MERELWILVVVALIGREVISWAVKKFFQRTIETDYVTVATCENCRIHKTGDLNDFKKEIRNDFGLVKGILLVVATKMDIPPEELRGLVK